MTSPGTILMAKMLVPETEVPATEGKVVIPKDELHADENLIGAIARGTIDGGKLAMNVAIMLISFLALVALLDSLLAWVHGGVPWIPGSLGQILGYVFAPVAWLIGVPWHDCMAIGNLLGTRMALNEVIAYIALGAQKATLAPRSFHDCDICAVRVCEPGVDRDADWRNWRAGSGAAQRPGEAGRAGDAGGDDGEFDFGVDCRECFLDENVAMTRRLAGTLAALMLMGACSVGETQSALHHAYAGFDRNDYPGDAALPALRKRFHYRAIG